MPPPNWITTACCVWSQLNTKPVVVRVDIKYGLVGFLQEPRGQGEEEREGPGGAPPMHNREQLRGTPVRWG